LPCLGTWHQAGDPSGLELVVKHFTKSRPERQGKMVIMMTIG